MSNFERENRYVVLKLKHMTEQDIDDLKTHVLDEMGFSRYQTECVVVESDWDIYEQTWDAIERMAEGKPQAVEELQAENNQLKARVGELEQAINECKTRAFNADYVAQIRQALYDLNDVLNETPKQSLVDLQVGAVQEFSSWVYRLSTIGWGMQESVEDLTNDYIKQLKGEER